MNQTMQQRTVHGALVGFIREFCEHEKIQPPADCMNYTSSDRTSLSAWISMLEHIAALDNRPALGLAIARFATLPHAGILSYLALSCRTLGEALQRYSHFYRLAYDGLGFVILGHEDQIEIKWNFDASEPGLLADETALGALYVLLNEIIKPNKFVLNKVIFTSPKPAQTKIYQDFFACPVHFGGDNLAFWFSLDQLNAPMARQDDTLREILESQATILYNQLPNYDEFDILLQETIIKSIHTTNTSIEYIAKQLGSTPRNLQRQLHTRGYSFQDRLNQVRCTLAQSYLKNPNLNLADIALSLGYSEQSAFQRAYKQWTGLTPLQWRKEKSPSYKSNLD